MNYYLQAFKQYADFSGRASRKEFWMFFLFNCIAIFILYIIIGITAVASVNPILPFTLLWVYTLATLVPNLSITVRRLRDAGQSGWMILVSLIPFVGAIWLLILLCQDSVVGSGEYRTTYTPNNAYPNRNQQHINLCPNCNTRIDDYTVFCENCGTKIK